MRHPSPPHSNARIRRHSRAGASRHPAGLTRAKHTLTTPPGGPVPARNSVHIEIIDVNSLLLISLPLPCLPYSSLGTLRSCFQTRAALQLEILALRHQINVLRRSQRGRVRLTGMDRLLWAWLLHLWSGWRSALIIVKLETVIAWHRRGFRL
jgi:hypothetical protein